MQGRLETTDAQREGSVRHAMNTLNRRVDELFSVAQALEERFSSVLRPPTPTTIPEKNKVTEIVPMLATDINVARARLDELQMSLAALYERCEL